MCNVLIIKNLHKYKAQNFTSDIGVISIKKCSVEILKMSLVNNQNFFILYTFSNVERHIRWMEIFVPKLNLSL